MYEYDNAYKYDYKKIYDIYTLLNGAVIYIRRNNWNGWHIVDPILICTLEGVY